MKLQIIYEREGQGIKIWTEGQCLFLHHSHNAWWLTPPDTMGGNKLCGNRSMPDALAEALKVIEERRSPWYPSL